MAPESDRQGERPRVLLVEDDAAVRRAVQLLLQGQGYDVRAYRTGAGLSADPEALRSACLVADLVIPEGNAIDLLQALRGAGWSGPALLISGHLNGNWAARALEEGFDAVMTKPVADRSLSGWVRRAVGSG